MVINTFLWDRNSFRFFLSVFDKTTSFVICEFVIARKLKIMQIRIATSKRANQM